MALYRLGCRVKLGRGDWTLSGFVPKSVYGRPFGDLLGWAGVPTDKCIMRYGGHKYADQCIWQKNSDPDVALLAASHGGADVDHSAAGPGRGNACCHGAG